MSRRKTPQTQTTTQQNSPPKWAEDLFKKAAADALNLYNKGSGGHVYQGERYAGLGDASKNAINGLNDTAQKYNDSPLNDWFKGPTQSAKNLAGMAAGDWIGKNNKLSEALNNALDKTSDSVNQAMAGAGRYGSGAHTGVLANELGELATKAAAQQYNQDLKNMIDANNLIDKSKYDQANAANNFYQGQSNAQNNALKGNALQDANRQSALDAEREKWTEKENQAWNQLEKLLNAGNLAAGKYGTQTGNSTTTGSNSQNPFGEATGLLGLLKGLFGLSDARVKENIVPVGQKNGYPIYEFNYKGYSQRYRGVIAQELLHLNPQAVRLCKKTRLFYVDYSELGFEIEPVFTRQGNKAVLFLKGKFSSFLSSILFYVGLRGKGEAL
ncbi:tail fiber domain-containing protein [Bartonella ancashensis]|uniref:Phage protein n=1 Tax=Bartonella ancashensis TaxID=1318743 RepID=A0A0M4LIU4_9HYPH|nr:tail fiber domain-containing protein [Bartonella ancashensis]ALE03064.1 Phage protein [Bartonella ancashensis]